VFLSKVANSWQIVNNVFLMMMSWVNVNQWRIMCYIGCFRKGSDRKWDRSVYQGTCLGAVAGGFAAFMVTKHMYWITLHGACQL
jgi:hypothetical protein